MSVCLSVGLSPLLTYWLNWMLTDLINFFQSLKAFFCLNYPCRLFVKKNPWASVAAAVEPINTYGCNFCFHNYFMKVGACTLVEWQLNFPIMCTIMKINLFLKSVYFFILDNSIRLWSRQNESLPYGLTLTNLNHSKNYPPTWLQNYLIV